MVKHNLKWTSIASTEIAAAKYRLEASVFNVEARAAFASLKACKHPLVQLWSNDGLIKNAFYPGRFKRIYVERGNGFPMILPSQMSEISPKATKFISIKTINAIGSLEVAPNSLLVTRSGTIGNCTIVTNTLKGFAMSDDIIRITFKNDFDLGFVYTFLKTKTGQLVLATNNYGAVIQHIEPEHLENVTIPNPPEALKQSIHNKIMRSFALRDESNELIAKAEALLIAALKLPPFEELRETKQPIKTFSVKFSDIDKRLDASYHVPIVGKVIDALLDSGARILPLGSKELTKQIFLPLRFKRVYVEEAYGKVLFGGKQLFEIDPSNKKYLSLSIHNSRIFSELLLNENMILVTRSGTVGKVNIVPKHWNNWVANDHILRITPQTKDNAGYLYIWLNTEYGKDLIKRFIYGSVVDEIEPIHLAQVPIPILKDEVQIKLINDLALRANELRSEAYYLEQAAIQQMNDEVIFAQ